MSPRARTLLLLLAAPLLVAMTVLAYGGSDEPSSDDDQGPPPPPPATEIMGTVAGTVTTGDGQPLAGAAVLPTSLAEPSLPVPDIGVFTGHTGRYEWRLHPGEYELAVYVDGERRGSAAVTVIASETRTLDFTLGP